MYATVQDMITRYGETEMVRLCVVDGPLPEQVVPDRVESMLRDASALIDSYLRRRYAVPVSPAPPELRNATCVLARHDLATGGEREPSEQMIEARRSTIAWLKALGEGEVTIAGLAPIATASGGGSQARTSDRTPVFTGDTLRGW